MEARKSYYREEAALGPVPHECSSRSLLGLWCYNNCFPPPSLKGSPIWWDPHGITIYMCTNTWCPIQEPPAQYVASRSPQLGHFKTSATCLIPPSKFVQSRSLPTRRCKYHLLPLSNTDPGYRFQHTRCAPAQNP